MSWEPPPDAMEPEPMEPRRPVARSGVVTIVAVANFVMGGLALACGVFIIVALETLLAWAGVTEEAVKEAVKKELQKQGKAVQDVNQIWGMVRSMGAALGGCVML